SKRTSPPLERQRNGVRRRPGGGASEASQVDRRVRHCPLPRCRRRGPLPPVAAPQGDKATWGRNQKGLLPRGTAVERGSTAEGREGARAKRARSTTVSP